MNRDERKKLVREISKELENGVVPDGSSLWRCVEIFKTELGKDSESKVFDDKFAAGIAQYRYRLLPPYERWLKVMYSSEILLAFILIGYVFPVTFPYIGNLSSHSNAPGLLEIIFVTFLISTLNRFQLGAKISMCEKILRTYVDIRHPEVVAEFLLLRWGINNLTSKLNSEEFGGYARKGEQYLFFKILSTLMVTVAFLLLVISPLLMAWALIKIFLNPSFGILSYFVISGVTIFFLANIKYTVSTGIGGFYGKKK